MRSNRSKPATEQAAEWYVELDQPPHNDATRRQFFDWLKQSPRHIEEFLAIAELEHTLSRQSSSIEALVAEVKAINGGAVSFVGNLERPGSVASVARVAPGRRRHRIAWATAAGLAAVATVFVARMPGSDTPVVSHRTELGEQRSIVLRDGSIVTLNTLSEARVRFGDSARRVTLVSGEAMFEVVRDPKRPFVVESGNLSVHVVGTKFSVYKKDDSTRVAVVEGTVTAAARRDPGDRVELRGGQGALFDGDGKVRRDAPFDLERAVAWTERRLIFENARLAEVVSEFNRYNRMQLQINDAELADRQITTVVNAHDVSALIGFLQLQPDVRVEYGADAIRISTAPDLR